MKKVELSGAQNRKKGARDEAESRQRWALDVWLKRSRVEADKTRVEVAEDSSDTSIMSQHNNSNDNDNIVSSPSARQDDDSNEKDFSIFLQRNNFRHLKKPVSDKLKITIIQRGLDKHQNKVVHLLRRIGGSYPSLISAFFVLWGY